MRLLKMSGPQCLVYAAAMALDANVNDLIEEIGHNGLAVVWPDLPAPLCYRSHHIQEIIDCGLARGFALVPIEHNPHQQTGDSTPYKTFIEHEDRFLDHIRERDAIMIGQHKKTSIGHAWAWDGDMCYDPNGFIAPLDDYLIMEAWVIFDFLTD